MKVQNLIGCHGTNFFKTRPPGDEDLSNFAEFKYFKYLDFLSEYALKADNVVELGVGDGHSTLALLKAVVQKKRKLISIDISDCPKAHKRIKESGLEENWIFIQEDDLQLKTDDMDPIDLLFIDTSHSYEHTKKELEKFLPLMADKSVVLLHDIHPTAFKVQKAIDYFLSFHSDWIFITLFSPEEDGCGLGLLRRA